MCFLWSLIERRNKWIPCHKWIQQVSSWFKYASIFGKRRKKAPTVKPNIWSRMASLSKGKKSHFFFFFFVWLFTGVLCDCSFVYSINSRAPPHAVHHTCATAWVPKNFPNRQGWSAQLQQVVNSLVRHAFPLAIHVEKTRNGPQRCRLFFLFSSYRETF